MGLEPDRAGVKQRSLRAPGRSVVVTDSCGKREPTGTVMLRAWSASERGQLAASLHVLKQMFKGERTLFGQTVSSPSDFFRAADKRRRSTLWRHM